MCKEGVFLSESDVALSNISTVSVTTPMTSIPEYDVKPKASKSVVETSWYREGYWRSQVAAWRASGESIEHYCKVQDIPLFQLYYWQRKY